MKPKVVFIGFFFQTQIQTGQLKKADYPAPPILNIFRKNFIDWSLAKIYKFFVFKLVEFIDAKGIVVAQQFMVVRLSDSTAVRHELNNKQKMHFFVCF